MMSELELVWIRECEVCAKEHRYVETHNIRSLDEIDSESGVFKTKCEQWYRTHIESLLAEQVG
ncbi:MAG: hypothetical protein QF609_10035 [Gammaproteobacteria bacterium]|nr:hypothetical protein [Gammaproteobacteria bacterium]